MKTARVNDGYSLAVASTPVLVWNKDYLLPKPVAGNQEVPGGPVPGALAPAMPLFCWQVSQQAYFTHGRLHLNPDPKTRAAEGKVRMLERGTNSEQEKWVIRVSE